MKLKTLIKDSTLIIKVKTSGSEKIDVNEGNRFAGTVFRSFFRPTAIKKNAIDYTGPIGISLYERLKKTITKYEFYFILEQVVATTQKIILNGFNINNIRFSLNEVFINENTKEVNFLYLPFENGEFSVNVASFIESLVYSVKPEQEADMQYVSRFYYFFRSLRGFDPDKIERFIEREEKSVVNIIKQRNASDSGSMLNKTTGRQSNQLRNRYNDDATALLTENDATALLMENDATALLIDDGSDATALLIDDGSDATTLLSVNMGPGAGVHYPSFYRVSTGEYISINKPVYRIGKEKSYVDYFVSNNNAVSRSHADIITRGRRYFIIDLNSKNRTYLNGQPLPAQCEIELHDGCRVVLGNEEFIFYI